VKLELICNIQIELILMLKEQGRLHLPAQIVQWINRYNLCVDPQYWKVFFCMYMEPCSHTYTVEKALSPQWNLF